MTPATPSKASLVRPQSSLLSDMELPLHQVFFPLGYSIDLLTNRPEVLSAATESFGHNETRHGNSGIRIHIGVVPGAAQNCPPLPIRRQYDHLYSMVADPDNQAILDLCTGANFVWINAAALHDPLYLRHNFLEKVVYLLLGASVVTDIHAGCVSKGGKGILLCGSSGAGKSTLSYRCARRGWIYTSDDTCYLRSDVETPTVIGHSHRIRFRPEARAFFPELNGHGISRRIDGKPSIEVTSAELPPFETTSESEVAAIVYLQRSATGRADLVPLSRGNAVTRLSEECYSAGTIRARHHRQLQKLIDIPGFVLHYSGLDDAIIELDGLVDCL